MILKKQEIQRYIYQNELNKVCFQDEMVYEDFKDLNRKTAVIKHFVIKHLILLKIKNTMDVNVELLQWLIKELQVVLLKKK